jgi:hypothetical protein
MPSQRSHPEKSNLFLNYKIDNQYLIKPDRLKNLKPSDTFLVKTRQKDVIFRHYKGG